MLIRFVINNVYSFGAETEFNMFPAKGAKSLKEHNYKVKSNTGDLNLLKMTAVYGANAAGKSNLVKALDLMQKIVIEENIPTNLNDSLFKLQDDKNTATQSFEVEFVQDSKAYYYGFEITKGVISREELFLSGLGKKEDKLIYKRFTNEDRKTTITFHNEFENNEKSVLFKEVMLEDFVKPERTMLKTFASRNKKHLDDLSTVFKWFKETLVIYQTNTIPAKLPHAIDTSTSLNEFVNEIFSSMKIGVDSVFVKKIDIETGVPDLPPISNEFLKNTFKNFPNNILSVITKEGESIDIVNENSGIVYKRIQFKHSGKNEFHATFNRNEESDGTVRFLDLLPSFKSIIETPKVVIFDEIERSIHPMLIKELVTKFSKDDNTKGQLIFTTHESCLLDQDIFRQDEIWFAEKDSAGITDLYTMSDYHKVHKTLDIRKGYFNGRFGAIPFLSNFKDLNWSENDETK